VSDLSGESDSLSESGSQLLSDHRRLVKAAASHSVPAAQMAGTLKWLQNVHI